MVTRIHKYRKRTLFLKEHRKAKGVSPEQMAGRLGIERESVYRLEREPRRVNSEKQAAWADALDMEPEDLWSPPGQVNLNAIISQEPPEVRELAANIVRQLVASRGRR